MLQKIASAVFLILFAAGVASASPASISEKPSIPSDLFFEFKPVPPDENAIINWRKADQVKVALSESEKEAVKHCWIPGAKAPTGDDLENLKTWLRRNREALQMFDESLKKPKAQWPERDPKKPFPELVSFSLLVKARLFAADQAAAQGKFVDALKTLEGNLKLAQFGLEGDAQLLHYLVAANARTYTQGALLKLASRKQLPIASLVTILNLLPSLANETNLYDRILCSEFLQQSKTVLDAKELADGWSKISETNDAMFLYPDELRRPFKVLLDPTLVSFHPKPLDSTGELVKSIQLLRSFRTNACSAWSNRVDTLESEQERTRTNLLSEIQPLMDLLKGEPLPLSRVAAQKARATYLKIENPVGRIMNCSRSGQIMGDERVFRFRTDREATRIIVALLIFERQKGVLPEKLDDLVEHKILATIPSDPFSGGPMLYSRERRIVWSVGTDGEDDEGLAGTSRWSGLDAVWQISELN